MPRPAAPPTAKAVENPKHLNPLFVFSTPKKPIQESPELPTASSRRLHQPVARKMLFFESSNVALVQSLDFCYAIPDFSKSKSSLLSAEDLLQRLTSLETTASSHSEDEEEPRQGLAVSLHSAFNAVQTPRVIIK